MLLFLPSQKYRLSTLFLTSYIPNSFFSFYSNTKNSCLYSWLPIPLLFSLELTPPGFCSYHSTELLLSRSPTISISLKAIAISKSSSYLHVVVICLFALRAIPSSPALLRRKDNISQPPCPSDFLIHLASENQWLKMKEQEKWTSEGIPLPFPLFGVSSLAVTVHPLWFPWIGPPPMGQNSFRASLPASAVWSLILGLSDITFTSSRGEVGWHH